MFSTSKWNNGDLRKWEEESVRAVITLLHASASPLHPLSQSKVFHICPTAFQHRVMKRNPFPSSSSPSPCVQSSVEWVRLKAVGKTTPALG